MCGKAISHFGVDSKLCFENNFSLLCKDAFPSNFFSLIDFKLKMHYFFMRAFYRKAILSILKGEYYAYQAAEV